MFRDFFPRNEARAPTVKLSKDNKVPPVIFTSQASRRRGTPAEGHNRHLPRLVGLARIRILIPSAVRVVDASQTVVVSPSAHYQIDLLYPMIRRHVESLMLLRDFHRLYRLAGRDVENIQQDRLGFAVAVNPLHNLVNATVACNTRRKTRHARLINSYHGVHIELREIRRSRSDATGPLFRTVLLSGKMCMQ